MFGGLNLAGDPNELYVIGFKAYLTGKQDNSKNYSWHRDLRLDR